MENKFNLKQIKLYISIFLLLLLVVGSCYNTSRLEGQAEILKQQIIKKDSIIKSKEEKLLVLQDSLKKDNEKREERIKNYENKINIIFNKLSQIEEKNKKDKEEIKKWNNTNYVNFFKDYFKSNHINEVPDGIEFKKDIPEKMAIVIFDKERYQNESIEKDNIIEEKDNIIEEKDGIILNKDNEINSQNNLLDDYREKHKLDDVYKGNLEKQNSRLKTQQLFYKIAIPVGLVGGTILGVLIAK
jgi:hypothetical protein